MMMTLLTLVIIWSKFTRWCRTPPGCLVMNSSCHFPLLLSYLIASLRHCVRESGASSVNEGLKEKNTKSRIDIFYIVGPPPPKGSLLEHKKELGLWTVILPSADSTVVRRTLTTLSEHPHGLPGVAESPDFAETRKAFWSSIKPAYFGVKLGSKSIFGIVRAIITGLFIGLFGKFALGRSLLLKFPSFFTAGWFRKKGPTEEEVRSATFNMWFVGHGYSDERLASQPGHKPDKEIITRVSGPEIGYVTTPITLMQCALIVLAQRGNLPKGGVYTAGAVFGPTDLQKRLQENGISFDFISMRNLLSG